MNPEENPKEAFDSAGKTLPVEVYTTCGYEFDCATDTQGEARPGPGDVTLCLKCGEVFQFDDDMKIKDVELSALLDLVIQLTTTKPMIEMVDRIMDTGLFGTSRAAAAERIMCEGVRIILKENPFIRIKKILI